MSLWRKKPVTIEAFRWTGGPDQDEDPVWLVEAIKAGWVTFKDSGTPEVTLHIHTLEGVMQADQGDWIIKGVKGELYPCKPDIFALTYERPDEIVRVLRVVEYVGPRDRVEDTVARSIQGTKDSGNGLSIRAATVGAYPDILQEKT